MPYKFVFSSLLLLFFCKWVAAQTDTLFWFAVPEVTSSQLGAVRLDGPVFLNFTSYGQRAEVIIDQPARSATPLISFTMNANASRSVDMTQWIEQMEVKPGNTVLDFGIRIRSTSAVSVYYEVKNTLNPELFVLKGRNALGNRFFISAQNITNNSGGYNPLPYNSFSVVATENNTSVTITPSANIVGRAANAPFTIVLQRGQTFAAIATAQTPGQHLHGSTVVSNKPVAVTLSDDLLSGDAWGGCGDLIGDQTIPVDLLGLEYIGIQGNLGGIGDRLFILAVENGTNISKNGSNLTTLNRGETFATGIEAASAYIKSDKRVYVWHLTGIGCELGAAVLPGIKCTGSSEVSFYRSSSESLILNILTKSENLNSFSVNGDGGIIRENQFTEVPGTNGQWHTAKVTLPTGVFPVGAAIRVSNSKGFFHAGVLQGGRLSGTSFGYFSDFSSLSAKIIADKTIFCVGETMQLKSDSLLSVSSIWKGPQGVLGNSHNFTLNNVRENDKGFYYLYKKLPDCNEVVDSIFIDVGRSQEFLLERIICEGESVFGYSVSGIYRDTFSRPGKCDSIRLLNLTVNPRKTITLNQTICEGESFLGRNLSGTYRDTLKTLAGCDSIRVVNLTVSPRKTITLNRTICEGESFLGRNLSGTYRDTLKTAEGCDSIRVLNLTVITRKTITLNQTICEGESFLGRSISGTYRDTLKTAAGCDSIRVLNLTVVARKTITLNQTICEGESFLGRSLSGTYRDTLKTAAGCDSIRILNLTVIARKTITLNQTICEGESFLGRSISGTYRDTLKTAEGCDSIRVLNLTVITRKTITLNQIICEGESFLGRSISGTYRDTLKTAAGCDSIRVLNLTVVARKTITLNQTICEGESFLGRSISGIYRDTLKTAAGCDSIRVLNLTVSPRKTITLNQSICEGESFLGRSMSGTYRDTLKTSAGCDSIRVLNLTVVARKTITLNQTICEGESFLGRSLSGTFRDTLKTTAGCDSIRVINLSVIARKTTTLNQTICEGESFLGRNLSGTYRDTLKTAAGCDSIRVLNLIVSPRKTITINQSICEGESFLGRTLSGTFRDTLKTVAGCDSIRVLFLDVRQNPRPKLEFGKGLCEGDSILLNPGQFLCYSWNNGSEQSTIWVKDTGLYVVNVSDGLCSGSASVKVDMLFKKTRNFLPDSALLCIGNEFIAPPFNTYRWSNGSVSSSIRINSFQTYWLEVTDGNGCKGLDSIKVIQGPCNLVFIPNAFTPNNDGINDVFRPTFGVPIQHYRCLIFNRWGQSLTLSSEPSKGWDGNWNGKPVPSGVFYYVIRFTDASGVSHERTGSVTLIR